LDWDKAGITAGVFSSVAYMTESALMPRYLLDTNICIYLIKH
jgi:hypothetical protein